ncbi:sensor histidine kinase [Paenibacillus mendelii]|uniref:Sensor histidine kinase n=1 Tax=Paenibacillus mendelii TaxID=206163 RepID=A0ABV6JCD1_9BACL|nr:histidine kinase [Paenibacillus mendelii]MCQ6561550.1 histidine kinase [Paenibacillus mendelii]
MRAKLKFPSLSLYYRLVLTFLLVLLPLYGLTLTLSEVNSNVVQDEVTKSMMSRVQLYLDVLEEDFDRILKFQQEFVNNEDLIKLSTAANIMPDFEKSQAILRLQSRLYLIKDSSQIIENVSVNIPLLDRTISSNAQYVEPFDAEEYEGLVTESNRYESPFVYWRDRLYISDFYPLSASLTEQPPIFVVSIQLSRDEIRQALQKFTIDGKGGAVLIYDKEADLIFANRETEFREAEINAFLQDRFTKPQPNLTLESMVVGNEPNFVVLDRSSQFGFMLMMYVQEKHILGPLRTFRIGYWLLSGVSVIIVVIFSYQIFRMIHQPLTSLVHSFRRVEDGNLGMIKPHQFKHEFRYLSDHFNSMVMRLNVLIHEVYEQRYRARLSELRHLQSQINPHFLYNSFFLLYRMAKNQDYGVITRFTKYLGEYYQFLTRSNTSGVTLLAEVNHARTYTEIQHFRFHDRISVEFAELPPAFVSVQVPRLIVQPIIENAYVHSLERKEENGLLRVSFAEEDRCIVITVEDNGDGLSAGKLADMDALLHATGHDETESAGIYNVHRRLQIEFGIKGELRLAVSSLGGLRADIVIPLTREGKEAD